MSLPTSASDVVVAGVCIDKVVTDHPESGQTTRGSNLLLPRDGDGNVLPLDSTAAALAIFFTRWAIA